MPKSQPWTQRAAAITISPPLVLLNTKPAKLLPPWDQSASPVRAQHWPRTHAATPIVLLFTGTRFGTSGLLLGRTWRGPCMPRSPSGPDTPLTTRTMAHMVRAVPVMNMASSATWAISTGETRVATLRAALVLGAVAMRRTASLQKGEMAGLAIGSAVRHYLPPQPHIRCSASCRRA